MHLIRTTLRALAIALSASLLGAPSVTASTDPRTTAWPEKVVALEKLQPLTRFEIKVPGLVAKGAVTGPALLRVHVDASGVVQKMALVESCGNADLDEAALTAMRGMRFRPYVEGGAPVEVTLAVPIHIPKRFGRTR